MHFRKVATAFGAVLATLSVGACGGPPAHQLVHGGRVRSAVFVQSAETARLARPSALTATPSIRGYDAVTVSNVPLGAPAAGCYASGSFANCGSMRAREPRSRLVTIATWNGAAAKILDTEPGDATPSQDAAWVRAMLARGVKLPGVYADAFEMEAVTFDLRAARIPRSSYVLWVANWNGNPTIPAGFDAIQYKSTTTLDYDSFSTSFWGIARHRVICFGPRATGSATCRRVHAQVRADRVVIHRALLAERSSRLAYGARGCGTLAQRERWFAAKVRRYPNSAKTPSRRRALRATRHAYAHRSCAVFLHRERFFSNRAATEAQAITNLRRRYS